MDKLRNNHFTAPATGVNEQVGDSDQGIVDRRTDNSLSPEEGLVNNVEQVASSTRFIDQVYDRYVVNPEASNGSARPGVALTDTNPFRQPNPVPESSATNLSARNPFISNGLHESCTNPFIQPVRAPAVTSPTLDIEERGKEGTAGLLKSLVDQFATVVKSVQSGPTSSIIPGGRVDLKAPRFDGTSDVHMFIRQFREVSDLNGWNDRATLAQLRSFLDRGAKDCGYADTLAGVYEQLLAMYGLTPSEAREQLHHLRKDDEESYLRLGNRVERLARLAYGGMAPNMESQMAVEHFDRAISDRELRRHLLVVRPRTLTDAVMAAESYALVGRLIVRESKEKGLLPRVSQVDCEMENRPVMAAQSVESMFSRITNMLEEQSSRIAALEQEDQTRKIKGYGVPKSNDNQGCWRCGGPHFRRNCPLTKTAKPEVTSMSPQAEN